MSRARLYHRLRRRRPKGGKAGERETLITLSIDVGDGRYPEEFETADLDAVRAFAWGLLADLDPLEAAAAAAEEGVDLAKLTGARRPQAPAASREPRTGFGVPRGYPPGRAEGAVLAAFLCAPAALGLAEIEPHVRDGRPAPRVVCNLREARMIAREGDAMPARYLLTEKGRAWAAATRERAAAERKDAA